MADDATLAPAASHAPDPLAQIPSINRKRYADAFKKVRYRDGEPYLGNPTKEMLGVYQKEIGSLTTKVPSLALGAAFVVGCKALVVGSRRALENEIERDQPRLGGLMSVEKATVELEQALRSATQVSRSSHGALKRLRGMIEAGDQDEWGPELVAKSFHDWDRVFFNGRLKGHCTFEWKSEDDYDMDDRHLGQNKLEGFDLRRARVKILLNADRILLDPESVSVEVDEAFVSSFRAMFGVLLHEMIHAYLAILTGSSDDEDEFDEGFDGSHGRHFQRCYHAVDNMTRELLGIAVSDDSEQRSSEGLLRKPFNQGSQPKRSDRGDSARDFLDTDGLGGERTGALLRLADACCKTPAFWPVPLRGCHVSRQYRDRKSSEIGDAK